MVRKADNNELNSFISEEELSDLNKGSNNSRNKQNNSNDNKKSNGNNNGKKKNMGMMH